jgi:SAM-dependent methyltransferase
MREHGRRSMSDHSFLQAGAAAVRFNVPLGDERAQRLTAQALAARPRVVVDFGCGYAELLLTIVAAGDASVRGIGVDTDEHALAIARTNAAARDLSDRTSFVVIDASEYEGVADVALCTGASHAFDGLEPMLRRLGASRALIGDAFWAAPPDPWSLETFGELPHGLNEVRAAATHAGWHVADIDSSTLDEWDAFEDAWCNGVTGVGTPDARAFASERASEYHDHYRGVLGFAWLVLDRAAPPL